MLRCIAASYADAEKLSGLDGVIGIPILPSPPLQGKVRTNVLHCSV
jgi:hypothetical protein